MAELLTGVGSVLTAMVGWMGTLIGTIVTTPILLIPFSLGLAFTGVTLYKSLRG